MTLPFIRGLDLEDKVDWIGMVEALRRGHRLPRARIDDIHFKQGNAALLNRAAWIPGLGIAVKTATIFPDNAQRNPPLQTVQALVSLFDDVTGAPVALLDGDLVTYWKTAADSLLGASYLARRNSRELLILGAGTVARSLVAGYSACFPDLRRIRIWNRNAGRARRLVTELSGHPIPVEATENLPQAAASADIIASATMASEPILHGEWIQPGTHVDLIGAFRHDMREADDDLLRKSCIFADARETTVADIGEFAIPIGRGVITEQDVLADLYDLCTDTAQGRMNDDDITLYKNGGGAHLDLMTAQHLLKLWQGLPPAA